MQQSCKDLGTLLGSLYNVDFQNVGDMSIINVNDKFTNKNLAFIIIRIFHEEKTITIDLVERVKKTETTKGLGKLLLYFISCIAWQKDYTIEFLALNNNNSDKLLRYYNSLGFTRKNKNSSSRKYKTNIDSEVFVPKLEKAMANYRSLQGISAPAPIVNEAMSAPEPMLVEEIKGGKRKTRKAKKSRKNRKAQ